VNREQIIKRAAELKPGECFFRDCPDPAGSQPFHLHDDLTVEGSLEVPVCSAHWNSMHEWMHGTGNEHVHTDEQAAR
jgi:hypothetical protein